MNTIYPKWKEALINGSSNAALNGSGTTGVYAALVDTGTYTYSAAHEFFSSLSGIVGTDQEIGATKTYTNGVFDGADITHPSVAGSSAEAIVLYVKNAGANTTWRLVAFIDGRAQVEIAVDAATSATALVSEDLPGAIGSGVVLTKISGTGPSTVTTSASASAGVRALAVTAIASGITAGAIYEYAVTGSGLPVTPNGGNIATTWNASGIFAL